MVPNPTHEWEFAYRDRVAGVWTGVLGLDRQKSRNASAEIANSLDLMGFNGTKHSDFMDYEWDIPSGNDCYIATGIV